MTSQGRSSGASPDVGGLTKKGQDLLDLVAKVLRNHKVEMGALSDKPQITLAAEDLVEICRVLKEDPRTNLTLLLCVAAVDYQNYIQMVYLLSSVDDWQTLALKVDLPSEEPRIDSLVSIWSGAEWYEREAHDLFGVYFDGHPNLLPLLLYEDFDGHPGLKEFPFHDYEEY